MPDADAPTVFVKSGLPDVLSRFEGRPILLRADIAGLDDAGRARVKAIVQGGSQITTAQEMDAFPNLGLIVSISAGHEGIDSAAAQARGVKVSAGVGVNAGDVAELAVGLLLACVRGIVWNDANIRAGGWKGLGLRPVRGLSGMKVGIVGLGHIGMATVDRLRPFGCGLAWTGPRPKPVDLPYVPSLVDLARQCDALVVSAHLDETTQGMVDREVIEALGPQGILVNVARGGLVVEDELIAALHDGRLGGAGLDVFETEPTPAERWRDVPRAVLTPHLGGVTHEALARVFDRAFDTVADYLDWRR